MTVNDQLMSCPRVDPHCVIQVQYVIQVRCLHRQLSYQHKHVNVISCTLISHVVYNSATIILPLNMHVQLYIFLFVCLFV